MILPVESVGGEQGGNPPHCAIDSSRLFLLDIIRNVIVTIGSLRLHHGCGNFSINIVDVIVLQIEGHTVLLHHRLQAGRGILGEP